jgi:cytochrome oxidase Cu insertion factor (SCO1/SenC/PrrC family)
MTGREFRTAAILGTLVIMATVMMGACSSPSAGGPVTDSAAASTEMAPEVSGITLDGARVSLSEYRGKPVVLAFMASW